MLRYWAAVTSYVHSLLLLWPFVLVPGKKRRKKEKNNNNNKKTKPTNQAPPACGQKCRGDLDCFRKGFTGSAKGDAAGRSGAAAQAPSQGWLCDTGARRAPRAPGHPLPCTPSPLPGAAQPGACGTHQRPVCVASSALTFQLYLITWMYQNCPHSMYTKYILLQKIVVYRPTTDVYVCVCVYTYKDVCVCV